MPIPSSRGPATYPSTRNTSFYKRYASDPHLCMLLLQSLLFSLYTTTSKHHKMRNQHPWQFGSMSRCIYPWMDHTQNIFSNLLFLWTHGTFGQGFSCLHCSLVKSLRCQSQQKDNDLYEITSPAPLQGNESVIPSSELSEYLLCISIIPFNM